MNTGSESGDKEDFLKRLRSRLAVRPHTTSAHPLPDLEGMAEGTAAVQYAEVLADATTEFEKAATALGVMVRRGSEESLESVLDEALHLAGAGPVLVTGEPETAEVAALLKARSREVLSVSAGTERISTACLGVTGARAGIARTGTIVVDSIRSGSRLGSALPPVHLAILRASTILPDQGAFLRSLDPEDLPSNIVLITGPSRSSDIELVLTVGVHGPGTLIVFLLT